MSPSRMAGGRRRDRPDAITSRPETSSLRCSGSHGRLRRPVHPHDADDQRDVDGEDEQVPRVEVEEQQDGRHARPSTASRSRASAAPAGSTGPTDGTRASSSGPKSPITTSSQRRADDSVVVANAPGQGGLGGRAGRHRDRGRRRVGSRLLERGGAEGIAVHLIGPRRSDRDGHIRCGPAPRFGCPWAA